jgi:hypothetical protein
MGRTFACRRSMPAMTGRGHAVNSIEYFYISN